MDQITFWKDYKELRPSATDDEVMKAWREEAERQEKEAERQEKEAERQHELAMAEQQFKKRKVELPCQFCFVVNSTEEELRQHEHSHERRGTSLHCIHVFILYSLVRPHSSPLFTHFHLFRLVIHNIRAPRSEILRRERLIRQGREPPVRWMVR
jgi:hypothetical protein